MKMSEKILMASITRGFALRHCELSDKKIADIETKIQNNEMTDDDLYNLGFEDVHFEGSAWTEVKHKTVKEKK